ncbi:MAG: THUMP domain-containing protein, partial [Coriobacteriales bacterium]|nr:THUMP domain-containing protein [Coriobacteriales bacterium]
MPTKPKQYEYFAPCARGAEALCAGELTALGAKRVRPLQAGVAFFGDIEVGYRACLWTRTASRVLLVLDRVPAANAEELYASIKALPWEEHLDATRTIAIGARGTNAALVDTRFTALKVKDAICDRLRELSGERPSVAKERPDVRIDVALRDKRATISLDLSGEPLHKRGYRVPSKSVVAPLRETLAATMLLAAGWNSFEEAQARGALLDPLCGSGTLVIEAALIALDRAPGSLRGYWGFTGWLGFDEEQWFACLDEADERAERALEQSKATGTLRLYASDSDAAVVEVARTSARRAGVEQVIDFSVADVADTATRFVTPHSGSSGAPVAKDISPGALIAKDTAQLPLLVVTNPPYGLRLFEITQLPALYAALRKLIDAALTSTPADLCVITADEGMEAYLGQSPQKRIATYNGSLEVAISVYAQGPEAQSEAPINKPATANDQTSADDKTSTD